MFIQPYSVAEQQNFNENGCTVTALNMTSRIVPFPLPPQQADDGDTVPPALVDNPLSWMTRLLPCKPDKHVPFALPPPSHSLTLPNTPTTNTSVINDWEEYCIIYEKSNNVKKKHHTDLVALLNFLQRVLCTTSVQDRILIYYEVDCNRLKLLLKNSMFLF